MDPISVVQLDTSMALHRLCSLPINSAQYTQESKLTTPLQRNLNNAFAYDLVPSPSVITAALRAARRVNDFPTAVRIFEGTSTLLPSAVFTLDENNGA